MSRLAACWKVALTRLNKSRGSVIRMSFRCKSICNIFFKTIFDHQPKFSWEQKLSGQSWFSTSWTARYKYSLLLVFGIRHDSGQGRAWLILWNQMDETSGGTISKSTLKKDCFHIFCFGFTQLLWRLRKRSSIHATVKFVVSVRTLGQTISQQTCVQAGFVEFRRFLDSFALVLLNYRYDGSSRKAVPYMYNVWSPNPHDQHHPGGDSSALTSEQKSRVNNLVATTLFFWNPTLRGGIHYITSWEPLPQTGSWYQRRKYPVSLRWIP